MSIEVTVEEAEGEGNPLIDALIYRNVDMSGFEHYIALFDPPILLRDAVQLWVFTEHRPQRILVGYVPNIGLNKSHNARMIVYV